MRFAVPFLLVACGFTLPGCLLERDFQKPEAQLTQDTSESDPCRVYSDQYVQRISRGESGEDLAIPVLEAAQVDSIVRQSARGLRFPELSSPTMGVIRKCMSETRAQGSSFPRSVYLVKRRGDVWDPRESLNPYTRCLRDWKNHHGSVIRTFAALEKQVGMGFLTFAGFSLPDTPFKPSPFAVLPSAVDFAHTVQLLNVALSPEEKLAFVPYVAKGNVGVDDYLAQYISARKLPIAADGFLYYHDLLVHGIGILALAEHGKVVHGYASLVSPLLKDLASMIGGPGGRTHEVLRAALADIVDRYTGNIGLLHTQQGLEIIPEVQLQDLVVQNLAEGGLGESRNGEQVEKEKARRALPRAFEFIKVLRPHLHFHENFKNWAQQFDPQSIVSFSDAIESLLAFVEQGLVVQLKANSSRDLEGILQGVRRVRASWGKIGPGLDSRGGGWNRLVQNSPIIADASFFDTSKMADLYDRSLLRLAQISSGADRVRGSSTSVPRHPAFDDAPSCDVPDEELTQHRSESGLGALPEAVFQPTVEHIPVCEFSSGKMQSASTCQMRVPISDKQLGQ